MSLPRLIGSQENKAEYVQRRVCFVNVQSSLHENVIFSVCALMCNAVYVITFAKRTAKHEKHKHWFEKATFKHTRSKKPIYKTPFCRLERYRNSPIPYLTRLLNSQ